ncbi:DUF3382 domain-containing protein, partial [bacterium]|nr:DUF3382 domain-containing protein [bacterium]
MFEEIKKSLIASVWFAILAFPILAIKVDYIDKTIEWRWLNMIGIVVAAFIISFIWRYFLQKTARSRNKADIPQGQKNDQKPSVFSILSTITRSKVVIVSFFLLLAIFPLIFSNYQTSIIITTMMYVILGLGLNIVVGMAGLLDLGYVAFYLMGAYTFALLNLNYGFGFWTCVPIAGLLAASFGVLL